MNNITNFPPSVGWATAAAFMVLPILTVVSQIVVQNMMSPTNPDPQQASMNQMMTFMPIMFGFFAMQVPQEPALYWVTSNIFSLIQQYFVTGWGGLKPALRMDKASPRPVAESDAPDTKRTKKDGKGKRKR